MSLESNVLGTNILFTPVILVQSGVPKRTSSYVGALLKIIPKYLACNTGLSM